MGMKMVCTSDSGKDNWDCDGHLNICSNVLGFLRMAMSSTEPAWVQMQ